MITTPYNSVVEFIDEGLTPLEREVVLGIYWEGLSLTQTAIRVKEELGIDATKDRIKYIRNVAISKIKERFEAEDSLLQ